jgi:hypothetical protein
MPAPSRTRPRRSPRPASRSAPGQQQSTPTPPQLRARAGAPAKPGDRTRRPAPEPRQQPSPPPRPQSRPARTTPALDKSPWSPASEYPQVLANSKSARSDEKSTSADQSSTRQSNYWTDRTYHRIARPTDHTHKPPQKREPKRDRPSHNQLKANASPTDPNTCPPTRNSYGTRATSPLPPARKGSVPGAGADSLGMRGVRVSRKRWLQACPPANTGRQLAIAFAHRRRSSPPPGSPRKRQLKRLGPDIAKIEIQHSGRRLP